MPRIAIKSPDDDRVRAFRRLPQRGSRHAGTDFVVEGRWLVQRLLDSNIEVASILCGEQQADAFAELAGDIPLYVADRAVIEQIVGFGFHRGVLACGRRPRPRALPEMVAHGGSPALFAACAGVCDPENLGSVIRNCRALGAAALLLDAHCADPFSRRVMRVSAGAALEFPIVESIDLHDDLTHLQSNEDFQLVATVLNEAAVPLEDAIAHERMVVVFGNEGFGLDDRLTHLCDVCVTLPMHGGADSLNVGVASGIFLHHFRHLQEVRCKAFD